MSGLLPQADRAELATLAEIGRTLVEAQLDIDELCELIYQLAGKIVPTDNFQLGLVDGDHYAIKVWIKDGVRQPPAAYPVPEGHGIIGWMRTSRQSLLVRDFQLEMDQLPARPTYESDNPPRSAIFLPLPVADTIIGNMSIQSPEPNAFDESHLRLLSVLANQSASALNNARLFERGQRRLNDLLTVAEVGRKITSILDLDQLLSQVVALIQSRFGYYHVQVFLVERGTDRALFKASSGHGLNEKWWQEERSLRIGQSSIIGWVAQHGTPLLANDVLMEPRYIPDDPRLLPDTSAELAVPITFENEVIGVLDVQSTQVGVFGQHDIFVLSTLADQVAVAVDAARAYEAQQEEAWITTVMLQVVEATSQAEGVQQVLDAAVRVTAMLGGMESCTIWLRDEELGAFQYGADYGLSPDNHTDRETLLRIHDGEWPAFDRLREQHSVTAVASCSEDMPARLRSICPGDVLTLFPMVNQGQVFGVMGASIASGQSPRLSERRLSLLSGIAYQVAVAVDNSRLSAARQEEVWVSTVLLQVAEAVSRVQPVDATMAQVAQLAPHLAGVDRCAILLQDDAGHYVVRAAHDSHAGSANPYVGAIIEPGELPLLDDACRIGQPLLVEDAEHNPRVPEPWRERFASRSILVVPLLVSDEAIGALLADDVYSVHKFSPRRVRILNGIASQTAVAIENARLQAQEAERARLARELELAQSIQRSLMPLDAPYVPGYEITYRWHAASEVGGDFFDFIPLPSRNLGLVIADVSDKGIPAALYMMFARTLLRAAALSGREPAAMLARTNDLIVADSSADMFVTAYYSILNAQAHELVYSSGGHNLALYVPEAGDRPQPMMTRGIALGIVTPIETEQKTLRLAPGDLVLFYTDGLTDALGASGEFFGEERLNAVVMAHRHEPAASIADAIETAVRAFVGAEAQFDDLTFVLVKRLPVQ